MHISDLLQPLHLCHAPAGRRRCAWLAARGVWRQRLRGPRRRQHPDLLRPQRQLAIGAGLRVGLLLLLLWRLHTIRLLLLLLLLLPANIQAG